VRGEYRYTAFGNIADASSYAAPVATLFTGTRRLDQNLLEFGVSYKFNEVGSAPVVVAADLPHLKDAPVIVPTPGSPWRGFYAGVNAGGVFDVANGQAPTTLFWDPSLSFGSGANPNLAYLPGGKNGGSGGALGGGQVGYNYQFGSSVVIGAEADIAVTSVSGGGKQNAALYASPFSGGALVPAAPLNTAQASLPYVGTLRGRAGYLVTPTLLLHTTAGFAYDGVDAWGVANTRAGWTVGAGAEWMFAQSWSAKLEYLYADISGGGISGGWSGNTDASFHPQINILRGGVNYHFNSFAPEAIAAKY
jgi:outer membrane immunogenic protein